MQHNFKTNSFIYRFLLNTTLYSLYYVAERFKQHFYDIFSVTRRFTQHFYEVLNVTRRFRQNFYDFFRLTVKRYFTQISRAETSLIPEQQCRLLLNNTRITWLTLPPPPDLQACSNYIYIYQLNIPCFLRVCPYSVMVLWLSQCNC